MTAHALEGLILVWPLLHKSKFLAVVWTVGIQAGQGRSHSAAKGRLEGRACPDALNDRAPKRGVPVEVVVQDSAPSRVLRRPFEAVQGAQEGGQSPVPALDIIVRGPDPAPGGVVYIIWRHRRRGHGAANGQLAGRGRKGKKRLAELEPR